MRQPFLFFTTEDWNVSQPDVETIRQCVEVVDRIRNSPKPVASRRYSDGWDDACALLDRELRKLTGTRI